MRLTFNTLLLLAVVKVALMFSLHNPLRYLYAVSYVQDAFLFIAIYFLFIFCLQWRFVWLRRIGRLLFVLFFIPISALTVTYNFFLLDLYHFPMNVFSLSAENFYFFMEYFTSPMAIAVFLGVYAILFGLSYVAPRRLSYRYLVAPAVALIVLLFLPTSVQQGINPVWYSLQEQLNAALLADSNIQRIQPPNVAQANPDEYAFLNRSFDTLPQLFMRYPRVLVLVVEGVNYHQFMSQSEQDPNSFLNLHRDKIKVFTRYHTLNIDSYTSLMAMLNSVFVPYSSHIGKENFAFADSLHNLVRFFNHNQYTTFFVTSLSKQQAYFVPNLHEWQTTLFMQNMDTVTHFSCINSLKIENACEDLTLLNNLIDTLAAHPRIFAFNEMVYGHVNEWLEKKQTPIMTYYNHYFNLLIDKLQAQNLLDSTLLVIVSDHGPKNNAYLPHNYHIPLLLFATNIDTAANHSFANHLYFKDILLEQLTGNTTQYHQKQLFTYGNSVDMVYGMLDDSGGYVFINNRMRYVKSNLPKQTAYRLNNRFQGYLHYLGYLQQQKNAAK